MRIRERHLKLPVYLIYNSSIKVFVIKPYLDISRIEGFSEKDKYNAELICLTNRSEASVKKYISDVIKEFSSDFDYVEGNLFCTTSRDLIKRLIKILQNELVE